VDVEWHIGSTHDSGARGPGFDSHPDPGWHFNGKTLVPLLSDSSLKNNLIHLLFCDVKLKKKILLYNTTASQMLSKINLSYAILFCFLFQVGFYLMQNLNNMILQ
jgi:hypothetical protein